MKSLVILASGAGSNAENIICYFQTKGLNVSIHLISDNSSSGIFRIAKETGTTSQYMDFDEMRSGGLLQVLRSKKADLVILAGFLKMIPLDVVKEFSEKMVNIHPSILPLFGGKGMYGDRVHKAVIESGVPESGITIHMVNEKFDDGRIIAQFRCPVRAGETIKSLKSHIQKLEHRYFPYVIHTLLYGL